MALVRFLVGLELQSKQGGAGAGPGQQPELFDLPRALIPAPHSATTDKQGSGVVVRPSIVVGAAYEDVTRAYSESVHSVLTGERGAPEAVAALEKQLIQITGFSAGAPKLE